MNLSGLSVSLAYPLYLPLANSAGPLDLSLLMMRSFTSGKILGMLFIALLELEMRSNVLDVGFLILG